jgi:6-phosphogluconolactonase
MFTQHRYTQAQELTRDLTQVLAHEITQAIAQRGTALVAVSGGRSPVPVFDKLSRMPVDWDKVTLTLVDERCVEPGSVDSNAHLVCQHLLQNAARGAHFVPWITQTDWQQHAQQGEQLQTKCEQRLGALAWPLDVVVLGMGTDGHTASLFPFSPGTQNAITSESCCAWVKPANAPHERLSLTLSRLLSATHIHLQFSGKDKQQVFEAACAQASPTYPVSYVLNQSQRDVQIWIGESA